MRATRSQGWGSDGLAPILGAEGAWSVGWAWYSALEGGIDCIYRILVEFTQRHSGCTHATMMQGEVSVQGTW